MEVSGLEADFAEAVGAEGVVADRLEFGKHKQALDAGAALITVERPSAKGHQAGEIPVV